MDKNLILFDFSDDVIAKMKEEQSIPIDFYNRKGQTLVYKKESANEHEIDQLLKFKTQGIYYNIRDEAKLGRHTVQEEDVPTEEGLSNKKLFDRKEIDDFKSGTVELFDSLEKGAVDSIFAQKTRERVGNVFENFRTQEDMKTGLVNILELLKSDDPKNFNAELAVKKTVVAMAMKTRGLNAQNAREESKIQAMVMTTMMSALFSDIGKMRMNIPSHSDLSEQEFAYLRRFPLMSYLMIAHEPTIDPMVKRNILCQRCPLPDDSIGNNYPPKKWLITNFNGLVEKHKDNPNLLKSLAEQIYLINRPITFDEDANILALSSEYASLTSKVQWRDAFSSKRAIQMIINNSIFTYTARIMREFLDYVSMSLNDNQRILDDGDFVVLAIQSTKGYMYEIAKITRASKFQSIPDVIKVADINMEMVEKAGKKIILPPKVENMKTNVRRGEYLLQKDQSRRLAYAIDSEYDPEVYETLSNLKGV